MGPRRRRPPEGGLRDDESVLAVVQGPEGESSFPTNPCSYMMYNDSDRLDVVSGIVRTSDQHLLRRRVVR